MRILLIDNYDSFTFNIVELLREVGIAEIDVIKNDDPFPDDVTDYSHLILSPGPATPKESGCLMDIIRRHYRSKPMLGICLGHQAIAEVFGASLRNLNKPHHGYRSTLQCIQPSTLFKEMPLRFTVGLYHSWVVDEESMPSELEVTAVSSDNHIMAFQHQQYPVYGVQFHPESYMTEYGLKLMQNFLQTT